ncbi:hypothetical protein BO78DRAFT_421267 [Aspergillus sclerotiicarbonarius CBS 121057]|uniref:Uncharacterized protein n=1 Tax=Aspergillus sclerotiicarbonarius (strain CBS 121057 / IBT 28362) TaxID=1448318 RepID=A0A319EJA3_ASPSB|nr:hypothetical protein BO78DRAFT_421267 [Aspergillus sclerotiicarbonarius CBS 121057]
MGHHHKTLCKETVAKPPSSKWTTSSCAAFRKDSDKTSTIQTCCGTTTNITEYDTCYGFCSTNGNQSAVVSCLEDAGLKAKAYNRSDASGAGAVMVVSGSVSKGALGIAMLAFLGVVMDSFVV